MSTSDQRNDQHGATPINPVIRAANDLSARWSASLGNEDYALSAAGLWPLLALLASAADEPARAELATALGRPADSTQRDAVELLDILRSGRSTTAAMAIWTREDVALRDDWSSQLPAGVVGQLTDQAALDRWSARETDGLIDSFPLEITTHTLLVLASALAARVRWQDPFDTYPRHRASGSDEPDQQWLFRTTYDLTAAAVLDAGVTRIVVEGDGDVDVHVLLGDREPADVLATGLRELSGDARVHSAADLDPGSDAPGMTVRVVKSAGPQDRLELRLPSFEIRSRHDLLEHSDVFGLRSVVDATRSHLPLLSSTPLYVSEGAQDVVARFFDVGFEAAAVSGFGMPLGGVPEERFDVRRVDVTFDRPFGFLAVHRPSRLATVAGWVKSPFSDHA